MSFAREAVRDQRGEGLQEPTRDVVGLAEDEPDNDDRRQEKNATENRGSHEARNRTNVSRSFVTQMSQ